MNAMNGKKHVDALLLENRYGSIDADSFDRGSDGKLV